MKEDVTQRAYLEDRTKPEIGANITRTAEGGIKCVELETVDQDGRIVIKTTPEYTIRLRDFLTELIEKELSDGTQGTTEESTTAESAAVHESDVNTKPSLTCLEGPAKKSDGDSPH